MYQTVVISTTLFCPLVITTISPGLPVAAWPTAAYGMDILMGNSEQDLQVIGLLFKKDWLQQIVPAFNK